MTRTKSQAKWMRIAPRKLDRVIKLVRGMRAVEALEVLKFMPHKGAKILRKVIHSAVANAKNNYKMAEEKLLVAECFVNKAVILKRWQPRAKGRSNSIYKRTSHLTVWLESKEEAPPS